MTDLEGIKGEDLIKYGVKVEEAELAKKSTKFKILKGLFQEVFISNGDSFFLCRASFYGCLF
jgi:hypothetical protein